MVLHTEVLPNLNNGVSSQAPSVRLATQGEDQLNGMNTVATGQEKRPPLVNIAKLFEEATTGAGGFNQTKIHVFDRGDGVEQYVFVYKYNADGVTEQIRAFSLTGDEYTVTGSDSTSAPYITDTDPLTNLKMISVADTTFILNKTATPAMTATESAAADTKGYFGVMLAVNGADYTITVQETGGASYDGTHTAPASGIVSTATIAAALVTSLTAALPGGYTVTRVNHVIEVSHASQAFTLESEDSRAGDAIIAFKDKVDDITSLPLICRDGYKLEVIGTEETKFDNYFVEFDTDAESGMGEGTWIESIGFEQLTTIDNTTMPYKLVKTSDTPTFEVQAITWDDRLVGDDTSNAVPTFIGAPIRDIYFFANRLGLLADENVILSEFNEFFNFFRTTVRTTLASDPVDAANSANKVSLLHHAIPFGDGQLFCFSDQILFKVTGGDIFSNETVAIDPVNQFNISTVVRPVIGGDLIYWCADNGNFSSVFAYYPDTQVTVKKAAEVSKHVQTYIPNNLVKQASNSINDIICYVSNNVDERNNIYVYKYYWQNDKQVQSAWSKWEFSPNFQILDVEFVGTELIVLYAIRDWDSSTESGGDGVFDVDSQLFLGKIDISPGIADVDTTVNGAAVKFEVRLDNKTTKTQLTDLAAISTTTKVFGGVNYDVVKIVLPFYHYPDSDTLKVIALDTEVALDIPILGYDYADVDERITNTVYISQDYEDYDYLLGLAYNHDYTFSEFFMKGTGTNSESPVTQPDYRIQLRELSVALQDASQFSVTVTPELGNASSYSFTGGYYDLLNTLYDTPNLEESVDFVIPLLQNSKEVEVLYRNSSIFPGTLLSAQRVGDVNSHRRNYGR